MYVSNLHTLSHMRKLLISLLILDLTACGSIPQPLCPGTREYDVQYCRGEKPRMERPYIHGEAEQRENKCNQCIDIRPNCYRGIPPQCRPQWQNNK